MTELLFRRNIHYQTFLSILITYLGQYLWFQAGADHNVSIGVRFTHEQVDDVLVIGTKL